jgi:hypothetical protein
VEIQLKKNRGNGIRIRMNSAGKPAKKIAELMRMFEEFPGFSLFCRMKVISLEEENYLNEIFRRIFCLLCEV